MNTESIHSIEKVKPLRKKKENIEGSSAEIASIKLFGKAAEKLRHLETEANRGGKRRVRGSDIVALSLEKLTPEDLQSLRKEKATVDDHFERRFQEFLMQHPKSTKQDYLAHLLRLDQSTQ